MQTIKSIMNAMDQDERVRFSRMFRPPVRCMGQLSFPDITAYAQNAKAIGAAVHRRAESANAISNAIFGFAQTGDHLDHID